MSGKVLQLRPALSCERAIEIIRKAVAAGQVRWYVDGLMGMEVRSLSDVIAMTALGEAPVVQAPVWDPDFNDWSVELRRSASGRRLVVRVAIDADLRTVSVVTCF